MRFYYLCRKDDVSGTSGTGRVAQVAEFDDGAVVVRWVASMNAAGVPSTTHFASIDDMLRIHGHQGRTVVDLVVDTDHLPDTSPKSPSESGRIRPEDECFMRLALAQAKIGGRRPGAGEVGCVVVRDGAVLVEGHNEAAMHFDPTAHAEIVCLRKLGRKMQSMDFSGCTVYCTLQPCSMCTAACLWAKIGRIVYGATRNDVHSMYFDARHFNTADLVADAFRQDIQVVGGVLGQECASLYYRPEDQPAPEEQMNH